MDEQQQVDVLDAKAQRLVSIATREDYYAQRTFEMNQVQAALNDYYGTSKTDTDKSEVSVEGDGQQDEEADGEDKSDDTKQGIIPIERTTRNKALREKATKVTRGR